MNELMTDEQLDSQLGTSSRVFTKYRTISVDNGVDTAGTGATGNFVEKQYDPATKQTTRVQFSDVFPGIILAYKAQVADKAKYPSWRTGEFDPMNVEELIDIFPLKEGKIIKDEAGNVKKNVMTYRQLKAAKSTNQPDGGTISTYNYFIILYVVVFGEVVKLKFKGSSRGNYFNYSNAVAHIGAKIYNVMTVFKTYKDAQTGKYAIAFDMEKDANGVPTSVDQNDVREMRVQVAKSLMPFKNKALSAPQQRQVEAPQQPADNSPIREDEIIPMPEEEEISFDGMDSENS